MKVAIVGAGVMGLATAWGLARAGHEVTVYEQGPVPNPAGSSVDEHRLIRHPYGDQVGYMRMVGEAYRAWDQLWAELGERWYAPTGTLVLDAEEQGWAQRSAEALGGSGVRVRWLDRHELARAFPLLATGGVARAFHLETGGVLLAGRIVAALARHLASRGVTILPGTPVAAIDAEGARVLLEDGREAAADALVVAAGAWAGRLLPALASRVTPSRQVVAYLAPPGETSARWAASPLILDLAPGAGFYLVPPVLGTRLKVGDHRFSLSGDPDGPRQAGASEAEAILELCRDRLRDAERYRVVEARACFYTVEPAERFVVEPLGRAFVVSACSGHGFKFGALLGLAVAEAVAGRRDAAALARWAAGEGS